MFYLYKGTVDRENTGDAIILKSEVSGFLAKKHIFEDGVKFSLRVDMKAHDSYVAKFDKEEDLKKVIKDLTGSDFPDFVYLEHKESETDKKREALRELFS